MLQPEYKQEHLCLSFEEANILIENYRKQDLCGMIARLDNLLHHTVDTQLVKETNSLLTKIQALTPQEYERLSKDIESGAIIFPPNYSLPQGN